MFAKPAKPVFYLTSSKEGGMIFDPEHDELLKLTPSAAEMWKLLASGRSEAETAAEIAKLHQVEEQRVRKDVATLLRDGAEFGLSPTAIILSEAESRVSTEPNRLLLLEAPDTEHLAEPTAFMVLCAFIGLALFDLILSICSMNRMCGIVKRYPVTLRTATELTTGLIGAVCAAVEKACVWYPKRAVCLQRAAVTTCLLRRWGIASQMVLAVRPMPIMAHAWVEVSGEVVNDRPQVKKLYHRLTAY